MNTAVKKRVVLAGGLMLLVAVLFLPLEGVMAQVRPKRSLSVMERDRLARVVSEANTGYDAARYRLGRIYLEGRLVRQSYPDAVRWLMAAAGDGHVHAMYLLAMLYVRGQGVQKDMAVSYGWVKKLADAGHRMAQYNLGVMLETGQGVAQDVKAARRWFDLAAREGSASAIHHLRLLDEAELGRVMADAALRAGLIRMAQKNDAASQYRLGLAYLNGLGVQKDAPAAKAWLVKAAQQGFADAEYLAAYFFPVKGEVSASSLEWTTKAALRGHPLAAFNLAGMYEAGSGVETDWIEASRWYVYAGAMGNANAIARLSMMADTCSRFPERTECSEVALNDVASRSDAVSLYRIGLAFKDGDGIGRSYRKSLLWLRHAAGMGHAGAQYELGDVYENALDGSRSVAQARFWYKRAADQGHAGAAVRLKKLKDDEKREG